MPSSFDVIIVGAGPAGVMAARALRNSRVLLVDAGRKPVATHEFPADNLYIERQRRDLFDLMIGDRFESLYNLYNRPVNLKLKAPRMQHVTAGASSLAPVRAETFQPVMSFAAGGLANAWGAGTYRFTRRDLDGFPVTPAELEPFYDDLTRHIGISGANDDLSRWFGTDDELQPPIELSFVAADLLRGYEKRRELFTRNGVTIGRMRHAVLTRPLGRRRPYAYGNYEFFCSGDPAIYNPVYTLLDMVEAREICYEPEHLALHYVETDCGVLLTTKDLTTGTLQSFEGRTLILAAGALNSAKLVLEANHDYETRLALLDNPMTCLPLIRLSRIGHVDTRPCSLGQLNLVYEYGGAVLQGGIYGTAGPLRSDVLFELPLSISANAALLRRLGGATALLMMFYPASPHSDNYLRLAVDGALELNYGEPSAGGPARGPAERELVRVFRRIGFYSASPLCQYPPVGTSIHYAGTLPMQETPGRYQLYPDGRLHGTRAIYVVDGACFPRLPAKNLTFTIMANAMRIASQLRDRLP